MFKNIKKLLIVFAFVFMMPFTVFAEEKEKINVYMFKGETCGFCAKATAFFEGLDDEYKSYFNLVAKEVWYDEENASAMEKVAEYFDADTSKLGVPYIIIGEKTFDGYNESFDDQIKAAIKKAYLNEDGKYKDVVAPILNKEPLEKKDSSAAVTIIVIFVTIAGVVFLVYMAKDDSNYVEETKEEVKSKTVPKKSTVKKSTTKKTTKK